eukprot:9760516-Ditylum_brightwellii.AAC.1
MAKVVVLNLKPKAVKDKLKLLREEQKSLDGSAVMLPKKEKGVAAPLPLKKEKGVESPLSIAVSCCDGGVSVMTPPGKKHTASSSPLIHQKMDTVMTTVGDASGHGKKPPISSQNGKESTSASLQSKEPQL